MFKKFSTFDQFQYGSFLLSGLGVLFAFITCMVLPYALNYEDKRPLTNSFFTVILFLLLSWFYSRILRILTARLALYSALTGILLGTCQILGTQIQLYDHTDVLSLRTWFNIIGMAFLFGALAAFIMKNLPSFIGQYSRLSFLETKVSQKINTNWKYFFTVWAIIFICYLPYFLAAYPGVYRYDSFWQTEQITHYGQLNAQHPILHTLYLTYSILMGKEWFGSEEIGFAFYTVTQMLMLSAMFAYSCYYLAKRRAPVLFQVLSVAYFALVPFNGISAVTATKDTLFTGIFLLCIVFTTELTLEPEKFLRSKFQMIRYGISLLLMCMMRNNGIYILIVFLPLLILVYRKKYWKQLLTLSASVFIIFGIYTGPVMNWLDVQPTRASEAFSIPIQQMARAVSKSSDQLTDEELQTIYEVLPQSAIAQYNPRISDNTKFNFNEEKFKQNPAKYLKVYLSVGVKCPGVYLDSLLSNTFGFWYPDAIYPDPVCGLQYIQYNDATGFWENAKSDEKTLIPHRESKFHWLDERLNEYSNQITQQDTPVWSMLISPGALFYLIVLACFTLIYLKKYHSLLPLIGILGLWGTSLMGPLVWFRYTHPLLVCTPLILFLLYDCVHRSLPTSPNTP